MTHRLQPLSLIRYAHPVLAVYGDQTVTEVWNLLQGDVVGRHVTLIGEDTARPWLPIELRPAPVFPSSVLDYTDAQLDARWDLLVEGEEHLAGLLAVEMGRRGMLEAGEMG